MWEGGIFKPQNISIYSLLSMTYVNYIKFIIMVRKDRILNFLEANL